MTMLQIRYIESALHKAILEMDTPEAKSPGIIKIFRFKHLQLCRAEDKSEWIDYDSFISWKSQRNILYKFFSDEAKFLLMLED